MGGVSSSAVFQDVYWRCVTCFFDSSIRKNAGVPHYLFTNTDLPVIDGVDLAQLFQWWKIQIIPLPITYRLPRGAAKSWGNQFYILDIIKYLAKHRLSDEIIVLDCDCIWRGPVTSVSDAILHYGCLTYTLDQDHYGWDAKINGVTRQELARALHEWAGECGIDVADGVSNATKLHYHGGEIFAATRDVCCDLAAMIDPFWDWCLKTGPDHSAVEEEAHFLSILYGLHGYSAYTANPFVKRMWTTFRVNNVEQSDLELVIWHLPAEKRSGFDRFFGQMTGGRVVNLAALNQENYNRLVARFMGIPKRGPGKFCLDLFSKIKERGIRVSEFGRLGTTGKVLRSYGIRSSRRLL